MVKSLYELGQMENFSQALSHRTNGQDSFGQVEMIPDCQTKNPKDQDLLRKMKKDTEFPVQTGKVSEAHQHMAKVQDTLRLQNLGTFSEKLRQMVHVFQYLEEITKVLECSVQIGKDSEILGQMLDVVENLGQTEKFF